MPGNSVFAATNITNPIIPRSAVDAFFTLPDNVVALGLARGNDTPSYKVVIGEGVTGIASGISPNGVFEGCVGLREVEFLSTNFTSILGDAFIGCVNLKAPILPSTLTALAGQAFMGCSSPNFKSIIIPEGITAIANQVFSNCYNLESITFKGVITQTGSNSFWGNAKLNELIFEQTTFPAIGNPSIGNIAFGNVLIPSSLVSPTGTLKVPHGTLAAATT